MNSTGQACAPRPKSEHWATRRECQWSGVARERDDRGEVADNYCDGSLKSE